MTEQIFSKNGLYYRLNKFGENRLTLVFIHGLSGSSSAWLPYEKFFEEKYNVLSFDLRGHGKSLKYKNYDDHRIEKFAEDINELITHLAINKFALVSHSFGTYIAFEFLRKHQDKVALAVFLSPGLYVGKRKLAVLIKLLLRFYRFFANSLPFLPRPGRHIDYSKYKDTGDWNIRRMFADIGNTGLRPYLYGTLQLYENDFEAILKKIKIPTLIIHGEKDTIIPAGGSKIISEKIKNSKLVFLPGANHILVLNNFSEVSVEISKFLDENKNTL